MRLLSFVRVGYYVTALVGSLGWLLIYYRWKLRGASKAFEGQLRAEGLPEQLISELTKMYSGQFKQIPWLFLSRRGRKDADN